MPPKPQTKKAEALKPDESGIPKNDVTFKFEFEINQQNIQNILIVFEWFSTNSENFDRYETPLIENWQPKSQEDPNTLKYEKTFDIIRVDDSFAKNLCNKQFYIYIVNSEESKVIEQIFLDYGQLLTNKVSKPQLKYTNSIMKTMEIQNFELTISADKELLTPEFRHYLNPLEIEIIGAKELPFQTDKNYLPIYSKYVFFEGTTIQTHKVPQAGLCKWNHKHVFLLGLMDQTFLKEKFNSCPIKVEIHDRDEIINENIQEETKIFDFKAVLDEEERKKKEKEEELLAQQGKNVKGKPAANTKPAEKKDPGKDDKTKKKDLKKKDVKLGELTFEKEEKININSTNFGISTFLLIDFLKPHVKNLKLRAPIVPNKRFEDVEAKNLDLNTTARKEMKKTIFSSSYLDNDSFLVISVDLAYPLGTYVKPIKEEINEVVAPSKLPPGQKPQMDKKPPSREQKPPSRETKPVSREKQVEALKPAELEIYERAIYIFPYKSKDYVVNLQETVNQVNLEALNIKEGGVRALDTYALSEEEKKNRKLDYISGFEIIDNEFRMFILEGLSEKGIKKLETAIPRNEANSNTFKIFKNDQIKFKERIYHVFNVSLKKIRLRENLKDILINPNIYLRTKVPENIMNVLNQLNNIRKHWNLRTVVEFNLFPFSEDLIALERKYSDSLSEEDVNGFEMTIKKPKKKKNQDSISFQNKSGDYSKVSKNDSNSKKENANQSSTLKIDETSTKMEEKLNILEKNEENIESAFPLIKQKTQTLNKYSIRKQKSLKQPEPGEEIYIYSCQPNNYNELQLNELREKIRNDPNNFYTYSEKYLSLSIDPYTLEQQKQYEKNLSLSKMQSQKPFRTVTKKNKQEFISHDKKPPGSVLDDLKDNPWHVQNDLKYKSLKPSRGLPIRDASKKDFKNYIAQKNQYFSIPEVHAEDTLLNVEKEKILKETKSQEIKAWKEKLKGTEYFYTFNKNINKETQLDRFKGLLHDPAAKKGILLPKNTLENSKINMTKALEDIPSSIFHSEPWKGPQNPNAAGRNYDKGEGYGNIHKFQFDLATTPDVMWKNSIAKPTKQSVF